MAPKRRKTTVASSSRHGRDASPDTRDGIQFGSKSQREKYAYLAQRQIVTTRYADDSTLERLGLREDVHWMFHWLDWDDLMKFRSPTYKRLTLEFLSSLDAYLPPQPHLVGHLTLWLFNENHKLLLKDFNHIFGLPRGGARNFPTAFNCSTFWRNLTGQDAFKAFEAKASYICNPCFKYVHCVMAHTIFGWGDSVAVVRDKELFMLWAMMQNDILIDTGYFMANQLVKIAKSTIGDIFIGGLTTPIALALECDISDLEEVSGKSTIDLELCLNMKMVIKRGKQYYLTFRDGPNPIPLPNPARTTIQLSKNWLMQPHGDEQGNMEPCPPSPQPQQGESF